MDGEVITKAGALLAFGLLFIYLGINGWKDRRKERINLFEAVILKAAKVDHPLPHDRWDRIMAYVQPVLMLIFGPLMVLSAIAIVATVGE